MLAIQLGLFGSPALAVAQQRPTQNFLVGDRALGLAGAFVGLADDASAIFHNPAGLAFLPDGTLNTSLWAAAYEGQSYDDGYRTPLARTELSSVDVRTLPFFVAGSIRLGGPSHAPERTKRHVFGFGVLTPYASRYEFTTQQIGERPTGEAAAARLDVLHDEYSQWFGVSYAYLASAEASFGLSAFASHWYLLHQEAQLRAAVGSSADFAAGEQQSLSVRLERRLVHLTLRLGGLWRPSREIQLGLMLQPPALPAYGNLAADGVRSSLVAGQSELEVLDVPSESVSPLGAWELRAGAAAGQGDRGTVSLDASLIGPDSHTEAPAQLTEWTAVDAFPLGTNLNPTLRGALGYAVLMSELFPVRGGLLGEYTLPSSADDPLERASRTQALGAALSVGRRFDDFDLSFGVTGEFSKARLLTPHYGEPGAPFLPTEVTRTTFFFYLSGGSKAADLLKASVIEAL